MQQFILWMSLLGLTFMVEANTYQPFAKTSYLTSSFGESRGTRYHAGIDYGTEMQEGWPIAAPEDGKVILLRISPYSYGRNLLFQGKSGHQWLFAHLSGYGGILDSLVLRKQFATSTNDLKWELGNEPAANFRQGEILAYSGSSGIGNPHMHLEYRDSTGVQVLNPCIHDIACPDSLAPMILQAATWDASKLSKIPLRLSSQHDLDTGCLAISKENRQPLLAFKIADYGRAPLENPMSIYRLTLKDGAKTLYEKRMDQLSYNSMIQIRTELLWAEEVDTAGDWHMLTPASTQALNKAKSLMVEVEDFQGHITQRKLHLQETCPFEAQLPAHRKYQDSLVYTYLSQTWVDLSQVCNTSKSMELLDGQGKTISDNPCKFLTAKPMLLAHWFVKWPQLRTIIIHDSLGDSRWSVIPYPRKASKNFTWNTQDLQMSLQPLVLPYDNALAVHQSLDTLGHRTWVMHPKGLHFQGNLSFCVQAPSPQEELYWQGETSRKWNSFSKQNLDSLQGQCASMDELRDVSLRVDSIAPQLGEIRDTLAMITGVAQEVLRIPVLEEGTGIPNGNAIKVSIDGHWIPSEFDSEPSELVIQKRWLNGGKQLQIQIKDEKGLKAERLYWLNR